MFRKLHSLNVLKTFLIDFNFQGGCCSSRKMEVVYEETNETMWLSEHSTAAHIDNSRWNFTCSRQVYGLPT